MNTLNLHHTKNKLALIFTAIVFVIAFFLEFTYFSLRYYNISHMEQKEFVQNISQISQQIEKDPTFFTLFIRQWIQFKPLMNEWWMKWKWWPGRWFRFMNFFIVDTTWNIVAQNMNQDMSIDTDDFLEQENDEIHISHEWIFSKKIDISHLWNNYKDLVFFKNPWYTLKNYLLDLFFFFLVNIVFSAFFYFIWLFFVSKNLKPIEETLRDMNDFIHNANHELKTPISVISSNLQLIKSTKSYEEDLIINSINEIKRIDNLIVGLSNLSNIHAISDMMEISLKNEIEDMIQELKQDTEKQNILLTFEVRKNIKIRANKEYFYIMFSNLLRNAIKYNRQNGQIHITLDKHILSISNTWSWISQDDLPHIFDRFFKGEKSRNTQWFGIWLSLVKKICDMYDWKISVVSTLNEKTTFEMKFP